MCVFLYACKLAQHDGSAVLRRIDLSDVTWVGNHFCGINETARPEGAFGEWIFPVISPHIILVRLLDKQHSLLRIHTA